MRLDGGQSVVGSPVILNANTDRLHVDTVPLSFSKFAYDLYRSLKCKQYTLDHMALYFIHLIIIQRFTDYNTDRKSIKFTDQYFITVFLHCKPSLVCQVHIGPTIFTVL